MFTKLFILGRPGSGKSAAARRVIEHTEDHRFSAIHINDYGILLNLSHTDKEGKYFRPAKYANGFDVCDFRILDDALKRLEEDASTYIHKVEFILIEFARDDYYHALRQFTHQFIQDAYFLYINTDTDTCIARIYERTVHPKTPDDHFVSDTIIREYYEKDNGPYIVSNVPEKRGWIINNMGELKDFNQEVDRIAHKLLRFKTRLLPETDPLQPVFKPLNECSTQL